jgi:O-antigen/teichoic acid export membrane protein
MYHLFLGNVAASVLLAVAAIFIGRLLGPAGYGLYAIAVVTPSYMQTFIQLGIPTASTRFPAKYMSEGNEGRAVSFIYSMALAEALMALAAVAVVVPLSGFIASSILDRPQVASLVPLAAVAAVGQVLLTVTQSGLEGLNRMKGSAVLQVIQAAVKAVVTVALILAGFAIFGAVAGFTLSFLAAGLAGFAFIVRLRGSFLPSEWLGDLKEALRYSLPLYVAALAAGLVSPYLVTLMARYAGNAQIGGYGAAGNISTIIVLFTYPITTALFPLFSRLARDERGLAETYDSAVRYSTIFVVPVAAVMMALSVPITSAIYGRAYGFAGVYLALTATQYFFVGLGSLSQGALLSSVGETRKYLAASLAGSVTSLLAASALIPFLGVYGAIVAAFIGSATSVAVAWRMVSRRLGTNVRLSRIWRIYVVSGVVAALVYPVSLLPLHPIAVTLLGGVAFLLLVIPLMALTGAVKRQDMIALDGYSRGVGPVSYVFGIVVKYYDIFERERP